jgi:hypothetical protein
MNFRSTTEVIVNNTNELFNALSIYIPKRFAAQNIVGWDDSYVTADKPAVFVAVVDNYIGIMTGDLLAQWQPVFRQDTNGDVVFYLIVFDDTDPSGWTIQNRSIAYAPLTKAFNALFWFSYFKFMFDPSSDGGHVVIPPSAGTRSQMRLRLRNNTRAGSYAMQDVVFTNTRPATGGSAATSGRFELSVVNNNIGLPGTSLTFDIQLNNSNTDQQATTGSPTTFTLNVTSSVDDTYPVINLAFVNGAVSYAGTLPAGEINIGDVVPVVMTATTNAADNPTLDDINNWASTAFTQAELSATGSNVVVGTPDTPFISGQRTVEAGTYSYVGVGMSFSTTVATNINIPSGGSMTLSFVADSIGADPAWTTTNLPGVQGWAMTTFADFVSTVLNIVQGTNPTTGQTITIPAGVYTNNSGVGYSAVVANAIPVAAGASAVLTFTAMSAGNDPLLATIIAQPNMTTWILAELPPGLAFEAVQNIIFGTDQVMSGAAILEAGTYRYNDGSKIWEINILQDWSLPPNGGTVTIPNVKPTTIGVTTNLENGNDLTPLLYGLLPPPGVTATSVNIQNGSNPGTGLDIVILAGNYVYNDGSRLYPIEMPTNMTMRPGDVSSQVHVIANTVGVNVNLGAGLLEGNVLDPRQITPQFPMGIEVQVLGTTQGTDAHGSAINAPSMYFDLSLALAHLCRGNIALSWFWSFVKVNFEDRMPAASDPCWILFKTRAEQLEEMDSLLTADRNRYYWSALYLTECQNTTVVVHSENQYIVADVLAAWFAGRNSSGTFIGNKLSWLRLAGTRIKPLGWPSWLDSSINENVSADIIQQLEDMNVGHLRTISDNTPQESVLTMAQGVGDIASGIPVSMQMIAKFVDYTCSMLTANMVTDRGTLANPIMTDEIAYATIQSIVSNTLMRFAGTGDRLTSVSLSFPDFAVAKKSRTAISAATAWRAIYVDDLRTVEVSGGISAE